MVADYDKQLRQATEKIAKIYEKYNLGGIFVVTSATHTEFRYKFPNWSIISLDKNGSIRVFSKKENYDSPEGQKVHVENSIGSFLQTKDVTGLVYQNLCMMADLIAQKIQVDQESFLNFVPHDYSEDEGK